MYNAIENADVKEVRTLLQQYDFDLNTITHGSFGIEKSPINAVVYNVINHRLHNKNPQNFYEILDLLILHNADINRSDRWSYAAISNCYQVSNYKIDPDLLRYLLQKGANPNHQNNFGYTILHHAVLGGEQNRAAIELLLEYNANPNLEITAGWASGKNVISLARNQHQDQLADLISGHRKNNSAQP